MTFLYVIMREDYDEIGMHPGVEAVFASRYKAEKYINECNMLSHRRRYYLQTSFINILED